MSTRPIVLPELGPTATHDHLSRPTYSPPAVKALMRAAVELDRRGIVVTDEDVEAAGVVIDNTDHSADISEPAIRAALEFFAARKRGEA